MQRHRVVGELPYEHIENLVQKILIRAFHQGVLQGQLAINHERKQFAGTQHIVDVRNLLFIRARTEPHRPEPLYLLLEDFDIRQCEEIVCEAVMMKSDVPQAARGSLMKQERIVTEVGPAGNIGVFGGIEEIVLHELDDQGHIDMRGAFQLGQRAYLVSGNFEVWFVFASFCRNHVSEVCS